MLTLVKRNFLLYFRKRSGLILSLIGAIIPFVLYLVFLKDNLKDAWTGVSHMTELLDYWLISGTLAVTALTTTLSAYSQLAEDRERKVNQDLFVTDLGQWGLQFSYLISSLLIGFFMQVLMFAVMLTYFVVVDKISFELGLLPQMTLLMLVNSLLASLINGLLVRFFKSVNSLGQFATVVGASAGFLVGTYIPIGNLPSLAQTLMKLTPSTYMAAIFRQYLMGNWLDQAFAQSKQAKSHFEELMGLRIKWDQVLTNQQTYYTVGLVLAALALVWLGQNMLLNRRLQTSNR